MASPSNAARERTHSAPGRFAPRPAPTARPLRDWTSVVAALGGEVILGRAVATPLAEHELLQNGVPAAAMHHLVDSFMQIEEAAACKALGISLRTLQRSRAEPGKTLPPLQGNRLWQAAGLFAAAMRVFGDADEVERWMLEPAIGLDGQRPIDLLETASGSQLVGDFLQRLEYGVYS